MTHRFLWLVLLVSLGLNLGLGYRLLNPATVPGPGPEFPGDGPPERELRQGRHGREGRPDEPDSTRWQRMMAGRLNRMAERLDLSPEQVEAFRATQQYRAEAMTSQRRLVNDARARLSEVIGLPAASPDQVRQAIQEVGRQQAVLDSLITETILLEMETLEPDQRALYLETLPGLGASGPGPRSGRGGHHRKR
jgi:Spy/CpxP family protein refolding chaperone